MLLKTGVVYGKDAPLQRGCLAVGKAWTCLPAAGRQVQALPGYGCVWKVFLGLFYGENRRCPAFAVRGYPETELSRFDHTDLCSIVECEVAYRQLEGEYP